MGLHFSLVLVFCDATKERILEERERERVDRMGIWRLIEVRGE